MRNPIIAPIHPLIAHRRSLRILDGTRSVDDETLISVLEAARTAPSCSNNQPWRFVVSRRGGPNSLKACLTRGNVWAMKASAIVAAVSRSDLDCRIRDREYYTLGIGLAVENMILQGIHLGLVMHPIAGFDEEKSKTVLKVPDDYRIHVMVIIGYPGNLDGSDPELLEKEIHPTSRKPLDELVSWETWGFAGG